MTLLLPGTCIGTESGTAKLIILLLKQKQEMFTKSLGTENISKMSIILIFSNIEYMYQVSCLAHDIYNT